MGFRQHGDTGVGRRPSAPDRGSRHCQTRGRFGRRQNLRHFASRDVLRASSVRPRRNAFRALLGELFEIRTRVPRLVFSPRAPMLKTRRIIMREHD